MIGTFVYSVSKYKYPALLHFEAFFHPFALLCIARDVKKQHELLLVAKWMRGSLKWYDINFFPLFCWSMYRLCNAIICFHANSYETFLIYKNWIWQTERYHEIIHSCTFWFLIFHLYLFKVVYSWLHLPLDCCNEQNVSTTENILKQFLD